MKQPYPSTATQRAMLSTSGPLLALLGFLTAQRAVATDNPSEAFFYALLATFFGTALFGWLIFVVILFYFRALDRNNKK